MTRNRRSEGGWTVAEGIAALALIAVGLTASYSVLIRGSALEARIEAAELRATAAERIMERTLALPFDEVVPHTLTLDPEEHGPHLGWTAEVRVEDLGPSLKSIEILVTGGGRESSFMTMRVRRGALNEQLMAQSHR